MSPLIFEAELIGFKEGLKAGIIWLVFLSFLFLRNRKELIKPFYGGLLLSFLISIISFFLPQGGIAREYLSNIISMSFALFLILSAASLLHMSGVNLLGSRGATEILKRPVVINGLVLIAALICFAPDITGSMFYLRELADIREAPIAPYLSAVFGMSVAGAIFFAVYKLYKPYWLGGFFDVPQLLLFLAIVKLFGSGIKGIAELSLLPSVQRGFMKFTHDFIHQVFVFLMVPDHQILKATFWNFIAFFFGPNFAVFASLSILLFCPLMFIFHSLLQPVHGPEAKTNAERRKFKAHILADRRKKALPVVFFIILILSGWFLQSGETVSRLFIPKPKPVVADRGFVVIPLKDPTMDLTDGLLHKFSLVHEGEEIRIIIMKKSDNTLSICLDACEICPPEGYGQREDQVVCLYCATPLYSDTLGQPGGCNPIPLNAEVDGRFVRIEMEEIVKKWGFVKPAAEKEAER